jgi:hypothetical protein
MFTIISVSSPALRRNQSTRAYCVHRVPCTSTTNQILSQLDTLSIRTRTFVARALLYHRGRWTTLRPGVVRIGDNAFRTKVALYARPWGTEIRQRGTGRGRRIIDARSVDASYRRAARRSDVEIFWSPVAPLAA